VLPSGRRRPAEHLDAIQKAPKLRREPEDREPKTGKEATMAIKTRDLFEAQLKERVAPILADGTSLSELVDLDRREIKLRALNDPELHRLELQKVWAKVWLPVGHVSQFPKVGDYKRISIGEDPVILTKAQDGSINALLNVCSHRGMEICWGDEGNSSTFKCPYHGWVFDGTGKLLGAPFEKEMYGDWDKGELPLRTANVEIRHGVIFATFNQSPPSLEDYLTEFVGFFDFMFGTYDMVALPDANIFGGSGSVIPANWKAVAEQNSGDGYHAASLHHSLLETGDVVGGSAAGWSLDCYDTSSTGGHGLRVVEVDRATYGHAVDQEFPFGWFIAGSMFPSCGVGMNARWVPTADGGREPMWTANIGCRAPYGPGGSTMGTSLSLVDTASAERMMELASRPGSANGRARVMRSGVSQFLSGADDLESWMSETRVARGAVAAEETIKYNALQGASEPADFPKGLGLVHRGFAKDDNQWHFWLAYYDWMTRG
jgi:phenylpropionate dioxygenase-like ring-hydroxylating dioxygenase large terminal subunit